jgi:hypothetical protein
MRTLVATLLVLAAAALVAAAAAIVVVLVRRRGRDARDRRRGLARLADLYGLKFRPGGRWEPPVHCLHMALFREGYARQARDALVGAVAGHPAMVFHYEYCTGSGNACKPQRYLVALFQMPIEAPRLVVRSEHLADTMGRWLGLEEIALESGEFNRRYHVLCEDRKFAFDVCHQRLMQVLMDAGGIPVLEMEGRFLLMYDGPFSAEGVGDPQMARRFLDVGREVLESLPGYVLRERAPRAAGATH